MEMTPIEKHEVKIIKQALSFVGIQIDTIQVRTLAPEEGIRLKCFWGIKVHDAKEIQGSYFIKTEEHTRLSVIMAIGTALYLENQERMKSNGIN